MNIRSSKIGVVLGWTTFILTLPLTILFAAIVLMAGQAPKIGHHRLAPMKR